MVRGEDARRLHDTVADLEPEEYVFRTREGNPWRYPDFHSDRWVPARNEAVRRGLTKHATANTLVEIEKDLVSGPAMMLPALARAPMIKIRNTETLRRLAFIAEHRSKQ